jgi:hypothetical protein
MNIGKKVITAVLRPLPEVSVLMPNPSALR